VNGDSYSPGFFPCDSGERWADLGTAVQKCSGKNGKDVMKGEKNIAEMKKKG